MWIKINFLCRNLQKGYETSLLVLFIYNVCVFFEYFDFSNKKKEDKELICKQDLTLNQRNCILLRMGEKEVFYFIFLVKFYLNKNVKIMEFYIEMSEKMI